MMRVLQIRLGLVNSYLLLGDRAILVDCGYPGSEARILAAVYGAGIAPSDISLILVTHAHGDHYGSAAALREATGAPVACGDKDAADMRAGINRHLNGIGVSGKAAGVGAVLAAALAARRSGDRPPAGIEPDILFSGPASLGRWGADAVVLPAPGHTPGSIAVVPGSDADLHRESGLSLPAGCPWAVVGDLAFGRFAAPLKARLPIFAADARSLAESLRVFSAAETVFVGHGGPLAGPGLSELSRRLKKQEAF